MKQVHAGIGFGLQKISKETLGQVLRIRRSITAPTNKAVNWRPIRFAQLRERVCGLGFACESGLRDDAPVRGGKTCPAFLECARSRFHRARISKHGGHDKTSFAASSGARIPFSGGEQNNIEEIDLGVSGSNYGWNKKEGTFLFNPDDGNIKTDPNPDPRLVNPVAEYSHFDGIAVIGGFTYRGTLVPLLANRYIFGDLFGTTGSARLFYTHLGNGPILEFQMGEPNPLLGSFLKGFGQDDSDELYVMIDSNIGPSGTGGQVLKIIGATDLP
jgi:hypothetical protein